MANVALSARCQLWAQVHSGGDCCRVVSTAAVLGLMLRLFSIQLLQPRNPHNHSLTAKGAPVAVKGGTVCSCVCAEEEVARRLTRW